MSTLLESLKKEIEELGTIESQPDIFYEELMDLGIETVDQFEDAYQDLLRLLDLLALSN